MSEYEILIPGNYFCDLVFTGVPSLPTLGSEVYTSGLTVTVGGVLNTVIALQRLGVRVGWWGEIGTDMFSRFLLDTIEREGVDTTLVVRRDAPFQRVTVAISYPHDRAFLTYVDPAPTTVQMAFAALESVRCKHLHFTGLPLDPRTSELLDRARSRGIVVSMDCQDRPVTLETPGVRAVIERLDIFMPNAREAMRLAGRNTVAEAAEVLRPLVSLLVIKDGANGAWAWQGGHVWHEAATPVTPIDTTGAGDVFNGGFLAAFREGRTIDACLRWGNVCGGLSTLGIGGTATAPTRDAVEEVLGRGKAR